MSWHDADTCRHCIEDAERQARRKDFRDNLIAHATAFALGATIGVIIYLWAIGYGS